MEAIDIYNIVLNLSRSSSSTAMVRMPRMSEIRPTDLSAGKKDAKYKESIG